MSVATRLMCLQGFARILSVYSKCTQEGVIAYMCLESSGCANLSSLCQVPRVPSAKMVPDVLDHGMG